MRTSRWVAPVVVEMLSACSQGTGSRVGALDGGPARLTRGSAGAFVPLVPASDLYPRCDAPRSHPSGMGDQVLSIVYGEPVERRVSVGLDVEGNPVNYSDLRGDLTLPTANSGDLTSIGINFRQRFAVAMNRRGIEELQRTRAGRPGLFRSEEHSESEATLDGSECRGNPDLPTLHLRKRPFSRPRRFRRVTSCVPAPAPSRRAGRRDTRVRLRRTGDCRRQECAWVPCRAFRPVTGEETAGRWVPLESVVRIRGAP